MHMVLAFAPAAAKYLPLPQLVQVADVLCPVPADHVPAAQFVHCQLLLYPEAVPYVPAGQRLHTLAPASAWYPQGSHFAHAVAASAPEKDPAEHATHALELPAATTVEYFPLRHAWQVVDMLCPVTSE
jgi:hypothetical protein